MTEENINISGSTREVARNTLRLGRDKEAVQEKKQEHASKELGVRARSFYEAPDYDQIEQYQHNSSNLAAPPMPGFEQRWISVTKDKGAHLQRMLQREGWMIRDPKTVPNTYGFNTQKWGEYDVIMAGNELILCCIDKHFYEKRQQKKAEEQLRRTIDSTGFGRDLYGAAAGYKSQHASIYSPVVER